MQRRRRRRSWWDFWFPRRRRTARSATSSRRGEKRPFGEPMPARKCLKCGDSYPAVKGSAVKCPECGDVLQYASHATPDREFPPEIPDDLPDLTVEQQLEVSADWAALEAEKSKRGAKWSLADLIAEGPSDRAA